MANWNDSDATQSSIPSGDEDAVGKKPLSDLTSSHAGQQLEQNRQLTPVTITPVPPPQSADQSTFTAKRKPPPPQSVPAKSGSSSRDSINSSRNSSSNPPALPAAPPQQQQQQQQHQQSSGYKPSLVAQERENFLMFVKILFKILQDANEPEVRSKAQRIVMECRRRSQLGDPDFIPLMDALERRLRGFVGEAKWRRAHLFLHHYLSKRRSMVPRPSPAHPLRARPLEATAGGAGLSRD